MDLTSGGVIFDRFFNFTLALVAAVFAGALTFTLIYLIIIYFRLKKREKISMEMVTLEAKLPRDNEIKIDAAEQMFASLHSIKKSGFFTFLDLDDVISFEIIATKADIRFFVGAPSYIIDLVEKTVYGYYPQAEVTRVEEPHVFTQEGKVAFGALVQKQPAYWPIKVYKDLPTDALAAVTSAMSKMGEGEGAMIQYLIRPASAKWQKTGKGYISAVKKKESDPEKATFKTDQKMLERLDEKASRPGFETTIRIVVSAPTKHRADTHLKNIKSVFSQFSSDLNSLKGARTLFKGGFMINFIYKSSKF